MFFVFVLLLNISNAYGAAQFDPTPTIQKQIAQKKTTQKKKPSFLKRWLIKKLKKKLSKRHKKSTTNDSGGGFWLSIGSFLLGLGALTLILLAELSMASVGLTILYFLLSVIVGAGAVWAGIEAWRESVKGDSTTRFIAFFGILLGVSIVYAILQPFLFLF